MPPRRPVEISATTTPMTEPVAASLSAGTICGTACGKRSRRNVGHQMRRRSASARATPAARRRSPRRQPTATGKNARNAPSTAADIQRGHTQSPICTLPPHVATSGARAISGTVWDITRYGIRPRSTSLKRAITTASAMPNAVPMTKPTSARRNEYHVADEHDAPVGAVAAAALRVAEAREHVPHVGHRRVAVRGRIWAPSTGPPSSGPTSLYSSHAAATSTQRQDEHPDRADRAAAVAHCLASRVAASAGMTCSP